MAVSHLVCDVVSRGMGHFVCMALFYWIPQQTLVWVVSSCVRQWLLLMQYSSEIRNIARAATYVTEMIITSNDLATDVTRQGMTIRTQHLIALRDNR